ncbi:MAG: 30S ribosome-binding factor RbfA [Desulfobacterales bacterium]|nr:30S ribosome-binding factor RbfA [Desulfobacterales bacterium]
MKPFSRGERISGQIQKIVSALLQKKVNDPRIEFATITGVKMTDNLEEAIIYFTTYTGEKGQKEALEGFKSATGFIRKAVGKELKIRFTPKLKFIHDDSFDYGSKMDAILKSVKDDE